MTGTLLRDAFLAELNEINMYLEYLQFKTAITYFDMAELGIILSRYKMGTFQLKPKMDLLKPYNFNELKVIYEQIKGYSTPVGSRIKQLEEEIDIIEIRYKESLNYEHQFEINIWVEEILDLVDQHYNDRSIESIRELAIETLKKTGSYKDKNITPEELIDKAIDLASITWKTHECKELVLVFNLIEEIAVQINVLNPKAQLNTFRQAFILLMTIFDATVFDLVRTALKKDLFKIVGKFGQNEKLPNITLEGIDSFETFQDRVIEEQLKSKYLRTILEILKEHLRLELNPNDEFKYLLEMINRRNIHIHNRGIVDKAYWKEGNIYNLSIGEFAAIDDKYWERSKVLCQFCIEVISQWVDDL